MPLEQVKPGVYERPLDTLEKVYTCFGTIGAHLQREQFFIGSAIRLHLSPSLSDLKQAWKTLRHLHPRIAAVIDETGTRSRYTVPSTPEALEQWLEETFIEHSKDEPNASSAETLHRVLSPSPLFQLHYLQSSRELLFRTSHWRTDATGMMLLQDAYLSILSSSGAEDLTLDGSELSCFPPTVDELLCPAFEVTEDVKQACAAELSVALNGPEIASFKEALPNIVPEDTYRYYRKFSKDDTAQIIATSKKRGLKMAAAMQTALSLTILRHVTPAEGRLLFLSPFNIRKYLPDPWNGSKGSGGNFHTGRLFSFNMTDGKDFESISTILRSFYAEDIRNLFSILPYHGEAVTTMVSAPVELANQAPGAARAEMSPFGVVDDYLQTRYTGSRYTLEVEDWWLGVHSLNKVLQTNVWTRDGQLHLSCHYNEAFYEHGFVQQFMQEWESTIADEFIGS